MLLFSAKDLHDRKFNILLPEDKQAMLLVSQVLTRKHVDVKGPLTSLLDKHCGCSGDNQLSGDCDLWPGRGKRVVALIVCQEADQAKGTLFHSLRQRQLEGHSVS